VAIRFNLDVIEHKIAIGSREFLLLAIYSLQCSNVFGVFSERHIYISTN
jgi:hypothetical protein